jgi:transcriptional regulator with XRE-family HTH domain
VRRATGLLQEDLAYLLGFKHVASVSRIETGFREPDLRTAFACEAALGVQASTLFPAVFGDVSIVLSQRARERLDALAQFSNDLRHADRLTHLSRLAGGSLTPFDA